MKPFIDNQRGATMRHKAHRSATPQHFWQSRTIWVIAACVALAMLLTSCSPYNHPGTPRTPDPAYEGWGE